MSWSSDDAIVESSDGTPRFLRLYDLFKPMKPKPTIEPFAMRLLGPKDWGTEALIAQTDTYIGKVLTMRAGAKGPLQYHERKDETFHLFRGRALVRFDRGDGVLGVHQMLPGESFHVPPGAVHQVEAIEDCVFFEASNPVFDDRVNVEAQYK